MADENHYKRMHEQIELFESGKLGLGRLIRNLKGLLGALETPDTKWVEAFQGEWWELEQIYAHACNRIELGEIANIRAVTETPENKKSIQDALKRMQLLLNEVI